MATIEQVWTEVLDKMQAVYHPPKHVSNANMTTALQEYQEMLVGFSVEALREGWQRLKREYRYSIWPKPRDIYEACQSGAGDRPSARQEWKPKPSPQELASQIRQAYDADAHPVLNGLSGAARVMLRRIIADMAFVQAQALAGVDPKQGIGYSAQSYGYNRWAEPKQVKRLMWEDFNAARPDAPMQVGDDPAVFAQQIRVSVGQAAIDWCKQRAAEIPGIEKADMDALNAQPNRSPLPAREGETAVADATSAE